MYDKNILNVILRGHSMVKVYKTMLLEKLVDSVPLSLRKVIIRNLIGKFGDSMIAPYVVFDPIYPELIEIGNNVIIGMRTMLVTHMITPYSDRLYEKLKSNPLILYLSKYGDLLIVIGKIIIDDNVFIGGDTTIRPGTHIHSGAVIASNSLVYGDITEGLWLGIPAKRKN